MISDVDADALSALYAGRLDHARCVAGCTLDARPGIVMTTSGPDRVAMVPGSVAGGNRPVDEYLRYAGLSAGEIQDKSSRCRVLPDAGALRRQFRDVFLRRAKSVQQLVLHEFDLSTSVDWRVLTPVVMAALPVVFVHQFGEPDESSEAPPADFLVKLVAQCQLKQWIAICFEQSDGSATRRLEDDLRQFVDSAPMMDGVREMLDDFLAEMSVAPRTARAYCFLALQARVYRRGSLAPPRPNDWAYEWLTHRVHGTRSVSFDIDWKSVRDTIPQSAFLYAARRVYSDAIATIPPVDENGRRDGWNPDEYRVAQTRLLEVMAECDAGQWILELVRSFGIVRNVPLPELADAIVAEYSLTADSTSWGSIKDDLDRQIGPLMRHRRVADLERIADALGGADPIRRVESDVWLCIKYMALDLPSRILERLGEQPRAEEAGLPEGLRIELASIRIGAVVEFDTDEPRLTRAREQIDELTSQLDVPPHWRRVLDYCRAMTLRHDPGRCMNALQDVVSTASTGVSTAVFARVAGVYEQLGRLDLALDAARESYARAAEELYPWPKPEIIARILRLSAAVGADIDPELLDRVAMVEPEGEPAALIVICRAVLAAGQPAALERATPMLKRTRAAVDRIVANAPARTRVDLTLKAVHFGAWYDQTFRPEQALSSWISLVEESRRLRPELQGMAPFADCNLYLARAAFQQGNVSLGSYLLRAAHLTMVADHLDSKIFSASLAGAEFRPAVNAATTAVLDTPGCSGADLRIMAEMSRGVVSRVRALTDADRKSTLKGHLSDDDLASLAPERGRLAVLEWLMDGTRTRGMLTVIDAAGRVSTKTTDMPDVDLAWVNRKLAGKLSNFTPNRPGSPFDLAEWRTCANWLRIVVGTHLDALDHLVVIPAEPFAQLPWHVAAVEHWTCSYQPNWEVLFASCARPSARDLLRAGVAVVPRKNDPSEVLDAMSRFVTQMRARAAGSVLVKQGAEVDQAALKELFEHTDVATVLAHGFIDDAARETFLMIARDDRLPLAHTVANGSRLSREHRFGWRDCVRFARAPQLLFLAACSSGRSHATGLGEQLGFFNALRPSGLRTLVAPRWDVVAENTLEIIMRAQELHRSSRAGVAACLRQAMLEAVRAGVPDWIALAMAVEGDWR